MRIPLTPPPAGSRPFDVVGLGESSLDLLVRLPAHPAENSKLPVRALSRRPGGQVATALVASARLGWRARYIGRFGDDKEGDEGVASLVGEGVDTAFVERIPGIPSHVAIVLVEETRGTRTVLWHRDAALSIPPDLVPVAAIGEARVLLVDGLDLAAATRAAAIAEQAGLVRVVDVEEVRPGVETLLDRMQVIIAAESFPRAITGLGTPGAALEALADWFRGAAVVCVTLGEDGCLARCAGREVRSPAARVTCVDSTGAGDVFRAGFIAGWLRMAGDADLDEVLRYANAAAALNCRAVGARDACPRPDEVEILLKTGEAPPLRNPSR